MWIDAQGTKVDDGVAYSSPDGTMYPFNFPKNEIPGLSVYSPTAEELAAQVVLDAQNMQQAILQGMTDLFDRTAQSRKYDNRITCALRAGYPGPFHAEGAAFATWMDTCNATGYALLAQVQAGTMAMPVSVSAALALLPTMVWP